MVPIPEILPVFPLPNVVFFPATRLPLHIFEPRYRAMTQAALATNGMIVMALIDTETEFESAESPPIHPVACAGRIVHSKRLPDGRYDLVLAGIARVEIIEELPSTPYRSARVRRLDENRDWLESQSSDAEIVKLLANFQDMAGGVPVLTSGTVGKHDSVAREIVLNTLSLHLDVLPGIRQKLLEESDLGERARRLDEILKRCRREREIMARFRSFVPDDPTVN
jgi:uncharacterized protein